ncbi:MAG: hypothetical protein J6T10_02820 [Methanobrevibacter sp.]|nr:hypothetical protein [Methanobrevibacter sp.]
MNAQLILTKNVNEFKNMFDKETADGGLHLCLGKVLLATQLDLITIYEMERYIDSFFQVHNEVKKM